MVPVKKEGILLEKTNNGFECEGVLNPAVIEHEGTIHIFYRAVAKGNYSSIGHCTLSDPTHIYERSEIPFLFPQNDYESQGMEDPRIVQIENEFYMTYTAFDGHNALGALATSTDLINFHKQGVIVPQVSYNEFNHLSSSRGLLNEKYYRFNGMYQTNEINDTKTLLWDKNLIFFPRRIKGKLVFMHRVRPDIQITSINKISDLTPEYWQHYFIHMHEHILLAPKYKHEVSYIGGGCPPLETNEGWLLIYHGVHDTIDGYVYSACAALLDINDPRKEISRLPYALFKPEMEWELRGEVNNVCFPTGIVTKGTTLYIYYGAADEHIAVASVEIPELLTELLKHKKFYATNKHTNQKQH